jgi:hypothetical protein
MAFAGFYGVNTPSIADSNYQCAVSEGRLERDTHKAPLGTATSSALYTCHSLE